MVDPVRLSAAFDQVRAEVLAERTAAGHWLGELSTSALSTATAVSALAIVDREERAGQRHHGLIAAGIRWLAGHQNTDGGWGDTDRSYSNIATTMLVRAAFHLAGVVQTHRGLLSHAELAIAARGGLPGLRQRYGRDKTFAVPILTNCALAGLVPWTDVSPLPFELARLPQRFYRFVRLPVVSYALPALVAIGQARFHHAPPRLAPLRWLRQKSLEPTLQVLQKMQPASGGYLEAAPLTSFVVMSLAACGRVQHPVTKLGVKFLVDSVRPDGSWPIDTNLATWNTTLALNGLAGAGEDIVPSGCLPWLLGCQHREVHPFTGAAPGGWGWSDLSGAVPDADDTPGALLTLAAWWDSASCAPADRARIESAAELGVHWLLGLQNRDGGWPTFCRGWGKLPFDRSGADLTAHALRALKAWFTRFANPDRRHRTMRTTLTHRIPMAVERGFRHLRRVQRADGSWVPLWFGNQDHPVEENPVYGTARVLLAYRDWQRLDTEPAMQAGRWLAQHQNPDGGWGGGPALPSADASRPTSSVEETALVVEALAPGGVAPQPSPAKSASAAGEFSAVTRSAYERGVVWLIEAVEVGRHRQASPIGFYFAKLWYYEKLYPLLFTLAALGQARAPQNNQSPQRVARR